MPQKKKKFNITDGPNKWDLLTAFGNVHKGQAVEFKCTKDGSTMNLVVVVCINKLEHKTTTGDAWKFKGNVERSNSSCEIAIGYYNTLSNKGKFTLE